MLSKITYNVSIDLSALLLYGQNGIKLVLKTIIRENFVRNIKFIKKEIDLLFDADEKTICSSILKWLNLTDKKLDFKYNFWSANLNNIDKFLIQHRNDKIKSSKDK